MSGCSRLPARLLQRREFRWAPVPQSAEGADSKPAQCAFESHRGHSDMAILRIARRPRAVPDLRRASSSPLREPLRGPLGTTPRPRAVPDLPRAPSSPLREPLRGPLGTTPRPRAVPDLPRAPSSPLREPLRGPLATTGPDGHRIRWAGDRASTAHDPRAVPRARPRGRGLDRRLLVADRVLPGAVAGLPRRRPRPPPPDPAGAGRAVLRRPRRPGPRRRARHHALAAPRLLRLLPRQHLRALGPR